MATNSVKQIKVILETMKDAYAVEQLTSSIQAFDSKHQLASSRGSTREKA